MIMRELDDLDILRCFDVMYRERHLTRAAARVGMSQPAMSRMLVRLRDTFDDPLFVRAAHGMIPTPHADSLEPRVKALLAQAAALVRTPQFDPKRLERTFVIAATGFAESQFLPPLVALLSREAPRVALSVRPIGSGFEDEVDVMIGRKQALPNHARHIRLYAETYSCAIRRDHPCARMTISRYVELPHLVVTPGATPGNMVDDALAARGLARRVTVRVHTFPLAPAIIAASDLVLTGPTRTLVAAAKPHGLRVIAAPIELTHLGVFAGWHPRVHDDPGHEWFRSKLIAACGR